MPKYAATGSFYTFHRDRPHQEIGRRISRNEAQQRVRRGEDVYTPAAADAKSLAKDVSPGAAQWHGAHKLNYFPHFYPSFSKQYGHVFHGERGYRRGEMQKSKGDSRT